VIELLRDAAHERRASILVVSHDHRIEPYVDACYHLEDGHLEERELPGAGAAHAR
jgi:putative ABC transport system ATP-binding protein